MDQVDQDYLKEILKTTSSGFSELTDVKVQDDGTTYEEIMVFELSYGTGRLFSMVTRRQKFKLLIG